MTISQEELAEIEKKHKAFDLPQVRYNENEYIICAATDCWDEWPCLYARLVAWGRALERQNVTWVEVVEGLAALTPCCAPESGCLSSVRIHKARAALVAAIGEVG